MALIGLTITTRKPVPVPVADDGLSVPITGSLTATVDAGALDQPTKAIAVTPSDSTDVTATATKGLLVTVSGVVNVTYSADSVAVGLGTLPVGTFVPGQFKHVNAATTATVVTFYG